MTEVSRLKQETGGEINVPGSIQLARTLIEHDLVDELRLKIFPVVLGAGETSMTSNPCASSTAGPSATASPSSPTSRSGRLGNTRPAAPHSTSGPLSKAAKRNDVMVRAA